MLLVALLVTIVQLIQARRASRRNKNSEPNFKRACEPAWRRELIEGTVDYYSTGVLPRCLPVLSTGLPAAVVCETLDGRQAPSRARAPAPVRTAAAVEDDWELAGLRALGPDDSAGGLA